MLIQLTNSAALAPSRPAPQGGPSVVVSPQAQEAQPIAASQPPTPAQLAQEVGKINAALQQANRNLELSISVDESTKKQVVKLTDKDTGDTILQYPSDAVLSIARGIDEFQKNFFVKSEA